MHDIRKSKIKDKSHKLRGAPTYWKEVELSGAKTRLDEAYCSTYQQRSSILPV